ncbi:MAG: hypothetical protein Q3980_01165 [Turicibacter sp.]|nr:hypothetical protein [Turicibacter sp.]
MEYSTNDSGIKSLGGFAYQIKSFIYYLANLKQDEQIEFETLEDINIKTYEIDQNSESYKCVLKNEVGNIAIQVKRTTIDKANAEKILYNWLILESESAVINKYILFTDEYYKNQDIIFNGDIKKLFDKINNSNQNSNALITKVKKLFNGDFVKFTDSYNSINQKYEFKSVNGIDDEILLKYEFLFHRAGISEELYYMRIQELMRFVTTEIMNSVSNRQPFIFTYKKFISRIEEISQNIRGEEIEISYSTFKKSNADWYDLQQKNSREYYQLQACNLTPRLIDKHLQYKFYYEYLRYLYLENNKVPRVDDIEDTTYDNFDFSKMVLKQGNLDTPLNRLDRTKQCENSYVLNEQMKYGAAVYMTREDIEENLQISWKDDSDV